jgi:hypothetical protein
MVVHRTLLALLLAVGASAELAGGSGCAEHDPGGGGLCAKCRTGFGLSQHIDDSTGELLDVGTCHKTVKGKCTGICASGFGRFDFSSGDVYEGEWKGGMKHGKGTYTWANNDARRLDRRSVYDGEWFNDNEHGHGKHTIYYVVSGKDLVKTYDGEWANGKHHGNGTETNNGWANGKWAAENKTYDGQWVEGKHHGRGKYTYTCGTVYIGDFVAGDKHGNGKATLGNGNVWHDGQWEGGFPVTAASIKVATEEREKGKKKTVGKCKSDGECQSRSCPRQYLEKNGYIRADEGNCCKRLDDSCLECSEETGECSKCKEAMVKYNNKCHDTDESRALKEKDHGQTRPDEL